jgi:adenylosuccinate lyase
MTNAKAISPIDGRYGNRLEHLSKYFSEYALMKSRCEVEILYAMALSNAGILYQFSDDEKSLLHQTMNDFSINDYNQIKQIEEKTKHDVKSCEIYLREKLKLGNPNILHFGLTSEDVNNLAYTRLFKQYKDEKQVPQMRNIISNLCSIAQKTKSIPFPSRTHGQKASPSTAGKEIAVFINRLVKQYDRLTNFTFTGKLNGAVGNYSAMVSAYPTIDWRKLSMDFIKSLGLGVNISTTQIEDHDTWADFFNITRHINNIIIDLDTDFWLYISRDLFYEKVKEGEVGSSTMPHKINPINFENSEGNMMVSNALLTMFSDKLTRSRMQRDLSDSTVTRNIGTSLAHSYLAMEETMKGLSKLSVKEIRCIEELELSPELLAEPIQTMLKTEGIKDPYTMLKDFTRGKTITKDGLFKFIDSLDDISDKLKERIKKLEITSYIGYAIEICEDVVNNARKEIKV